MIKVVSVNLIAVIVATIVNFALSIFLHKVVFPNVVVGSSKKKLGVEAIVVAVVGTILMNYVLAHVIAYSEASTFLEGLQGGLWMWLGFIAPLQIAVKYTNDLPWKTYLVNTFCMAVALGITGGILAAW